MLAPLLARAAAVGAAFNFFVAVFWVGGAALVSMETSRGRTRTAKATGHSLPHSLAAAQAMNGFSRGTDVKLVGWYGDCDCGRPLLQT